MHFEILVDDPDRALKFYKEVFDWEIQKWGEVDYWLIATGKDEELGINGALTRREPPQPTTVNTIEVSSVDEFRKKIIEKGGEVLTPKMTIPGIGYHSYCQDTEGSVFGIMESDQNAQ